MGVRDRRKEPEQPVVAPDDEVKAAVVDSFRAAGIPRQFRVKGTKLGDYEEGKPILRGMVDGSLPALFKTGYCMNVVGNADAMAVTYLTCRTLLVRGVSVRVVNLPRFRMALEQQYQDPDTYVDIMGSQVLAIIGFHDKRFPMAMSDEIRYRIDWAVREALMAGKGIITHTDIPLKDVKWWSESVIELLIGREKGVAR